MFRQVLLCYDGTRAGRSALRQGAELAILQGAAVDVLSIIADNAVDPAVLAGAAGHTCVLDEEGEHRRLLDESLEWLRARRVEARGHLARGNVIDAIVDHATRLRADLVVVGNYPRPAGGRWWSGPDRQSLAERLRCAVLIAAFTE